MWITPSPERSPELHLLGRDALRDWRGALRPGGRIGYTLPLPARRDPLPEIAALTAPDIPLSSDTAQARLLAESAGLVDIGETSAAVHTITVARTPTPGR